MNNPSYPHFFFLFLILPFASPATLSREEVQAMEDISKTLGKENWGLDEDGDVCSPSRNWTVEKYEVRCNCSFLNYTVCHITHIFLKSQNLSGTLPRDLFRLRYLEEIGLARNYLNGTIPKEWGSMNLVNISLIGNRLTGSIPIEIANISTLQKLDLESNQLSGNLPLELGNLNQIQKLYLTSNNFTGELPETLAKLSTLMEFRIGGNQFSGKIPEFIKNWSNLQTLVMEGSGLSGPISSEISFPDTLIELRISDLNGSEHSSFPQLNKLKLLKNLILRNCNINGTLSELEYLWNLTQLKILYLHTFPFV